MKTTHKLMVGLALVISVIGCKKQDVGLPDPGEPTAASARIKNSAIPAAELIRSQRAMPDGRVVEVRESVRTNETKYFEDEALVITPVNLPSNGKTPKASKFLVSEKDASGSVKNTGYFVLMQKSGVPERADKKQLIQKFKAGKPMPDDFNGAILQFSKDDRLLISRHFENGVAAAKTDNISIRKSENQLPVENLEPPEEGCEYITIDWYWQTYVNGVLVYEEYLYSSNALYCPGGGGGGGSSGGNNAVAECNARFNELINNAAVSSEQIGKTMLYQYQMERSYTYTWKCLVSPGGWYLRSVDIGTHERNNPHEPWRWKSIVHQRIDVIGMPIGGSVEVLGPGVATVTHMGNINANMTLTFAVKYKPLCVGIPLIDQLIPPYTIDYSSSTIFSLNPYPGGPMPQ